MTFSTHGQRRFDLVRHVLFLLGLLIGFAEGQVSNPRNALAAHLEGLMNGTFLIALGAAWEFVNPCPCGSIKNANCVAGSNPFDAR